MYVRNTIYITTNNQHKNTIYIKKITFRAEMCLVITPSITTEPRKRTKTRRPTLRRRRWRSLATVEPRHRQGTREWSTLTVMGYQGWSWLRR
ncbi:unnamed protein product [Linum tenue]|uniref:Uncharacterized protein n=1 Tax=Linum tenue TaxID=586396 RepID=A0AAV0GTP0_9ROSI|nr:unnamed protein product [Linum tenue]